MPPKGHHLLVGGLQNCNQRKAQWSPRTGPFGGFRRPAIEERKETRLRYLFVTCTIPLGARLGRHQPQTAASVGGAPPAWAPQVPWERGACGDLRRPRWAVPWRQPWRPPPRAAMSVGAAAPLRPAAPARRQQGAGADGF